MELQDLAVIGDENLSRLRELAGVSKALIAEIDAVLANRGLGNLRVHTLMLTEQAELSLASRSPRPSGFGLTTDGLIVGSSRFE